MLILVIYDISCNLERNHLIKRLQHYGLHRIQKSAFLGDLDSQKREELEKDLDGYASGSQDSVYIIPICEKCKSLVRIFSSKHKFLEDIHNYRII